MSRFVMVVGALLAGFVLLPACGERVSDAVELTAKAKEFVELLGRGDFARAAEGFDNVMKGALPPSKLQEVWKSLGLQNGSFKGQRGVRAEKETGFEVRYVTCDFAKATVDVKLVFNSRGEISGLWFVPSRARAGYKPPAYANLESFDEKEVTVGAGEWALPGTLSLPEGFGPFPAVVLVHGSGPHDRDETLGPNKPFRDLAWGLASRGVAVLRYDKRTKVHVEKLVAIQNKVTVNEETVEDAAAAASLLRTTGKIDAKRIFVLGHSLGGMMIPRIGKRDPEIAGFVFMAGAARRMEDVILEQMSYIFSLDGMISDEEKAALEEMRARVAKMKDPELSPESASSLLPHGVPASYWLDLRGYDAPNEAKGLKQPMLIIQGGRDYQVTMEDFGRWKEALSSRDDVVLKIYPLLNHLFIPGEGKSVPREYGKPGHVAGEVIDDIADWIKKQPASRSRRD